MTDADQPAEKSLVGIKGWLLLYAIVVGLQASSLLGKVMAQWRSDVYLGVGDRLTTIFFFIAYLVGLYFLLEVRKPITRKYHIGLNCFWAATLLLLAALMGDLDLWADCVAMSIWAAYWVRSKRVRATYCQDTGQGG